MARLFEYFKYINEKHWGNSPYQWVLYAGIILILLFEKRKTAKLVFGVFPLVYLLAIYNPLSVRLASKIWPAPDAYYVRLFSFMPLIFCMAAGIMQIVVKATGGVKFLLVFFVSCGIALTGNNFYHADWMRPAQNVQKVPQAAIDILKVLPRSKENTCIAFPLPLSIYMRQLDASIQMPYGRSINALGAELDQPVPDVDSIMRMAGEQYTDYIVFANTPEALNCFGEKGYFPVAETSAYLIYKVDGARKRRELNEKKQVTFEAKYTESGEAEPNRAEVYAHSYDYDAYGNRTKETNLDQAGRPTCARTHYASIEKSYYISGRVRTVRYLDESDRPLLRDGRYETGFSYDTSGRVRRESYYDDAGKPMNRLDGGFAGREISYTPGGKVSQERYLDERGRLKLSSWGFACLTREYDDEARLIKAIYCDDNGRVTGEVGRDEPIRSTCMGDFVQNTQGARIDEDGAISFKTDIERNHFNVVRFRLRDAVTEKDLLYFGDIRETGVASGEYLHELPSGIYWLDFRGNANITGEYISSLVYLAEGETLYYKYCVDEFREKSLHVSDFYIGKAKWNDDMSSPVSDPENS